MAEENSKRSYPYLAANMWASLRAAFVKKAPRTVTIDYLQSALGLSEKNAKNVQPQLRNLGIIDADNQLTDLGRDLRSDEHYAEACERIVASVYPDALTEVFASPSDDDQERITSWFMRNANSAQATAKVQARFYALLKSGEIPTADSPPKRRVAREQKPPPVKRPEKEDNNPKSKVGPADRSPEGGDDNANSRSSSALSLQLNLQVHISPESTPEQIDSIFASIRKHLNG